MLLKLCEFASSLIEATRRLFQPDIRTNSVGLSDNGNAIDSVGLICEVNPRQHVLESRVVTERIKPRIDL
jgi:hypothetical protein